MIYMKHLFLSLTLLLLTACGMVSDDDEAIRVAETWGNAYFNCDYPRAAEYSTKESERWLRFAASNTTEGDLQLLRDQRAVATASDFFTAANDTLRVVTLHVDHYVKPALLGQQTAKQADGEFHVTVVKRGRQWRVRMEGLPRSEKQSRD
jgi:hypothetical protein